MTSLDVSLIKVPLLVAYTVCVYKGMTPPNTGAQTTSTNTNSSLKTTALEVLGTCAALASKALLCGVAVAEIAALLAQHYPSALSSIILGLLFTHNPPGASAHSLTPASAVGCLLGIIGGLGRIWCHRALGRFYVWDMVICDRHKLVTTGPYAVVRHPGYAAFVVMLSGNVLLLASTGSYFAEAGLWGAESAAGWRWATGLVMAHLAWVGASLCWRTKDEDAMLRGEFGERWEEWARRTRYRLVPLVY
ncbi:hypothetical protein GSI_04182 [Ganoderma sinense ZZ0214-1]|uniref:Protein-S-isoprenylcysteine O-methyltransferase n=1 Tax=Ganoderma sinense ZZ0214-1 TaxID=1077348 RepID=A0A2G8SIG5_9APHY|nr:hypothetical protein GSI_04182 [Ganoderma sinense ZZ0214-1]